MVGAGAVITRPRRKRLRRSRKTRPGILLKHVLPRTRTKFILFFDRECLEGFQRRLLIHPVRYWDVLARKHNKERKCDHR